MKIFVIHDKRGAIASMGAPAPEPSGSVGLQPGPGHSVCILEVSEIEHPQHFAKYLKEFRVDVRSHPPKLVKRRSRSA